MRKTIMALILPAVLALTAATSLAGDCACDTCDCKADAPDECTLDAFDVITSTTTRIRKISGCIDYQRQSFKVCCDDEMKTNLVHTERTLRKEGHDICREIENNKDTLKNKDDIKAIQKIQRAISFSDCGSLYNTFDDYEQFMFRAQIGYEYAAVNDMFKEGAPRIGFVIYNRLWEGNIAESDRGWRLFYGIHQSITAQLTGSAEHVATTKNTFSNSTSVNLGNKRSLEFEATVFLPVYRSQSINFDNLWGYFGPIAALGGNKVDESDRAAGRQYAGGRFAWTPEWYIDLLYGHTEGLESKRVECRFQLPVSKSPVIKDSRIFLGAIGNFGVGDKRQNEADIIRAYLLWNTDFMKLFVNTPQTGK